MFTRSIDSSAPVLAGRKTDKQWRILPNSYSSITFGKCTTPNELEKLSKALGKALPMNGDGDDKASWIDGFRVAVPS